MIILNAVLHFARDVRCFAFCVQFLELCVKFKKKKKKKKRQSFENVCKQLKKKTVNHSIVETFCHFCTFFSTQTLIEKQRATFPQEL